MSNEQQLHVSLFTVLIIAISMGLWVNTEKETQKEVEEPVITETEIKVLDSYELTPNLSIEKITNEYTRLAILEVDTQYEYNYLEKKETIHTCDDYKNIFEKYKWNVQTITEICEEESGGDTEAVGDSHIPPVSCGLLQVRTLNGRPTCEELKDPETNIAYAYKLYEDSLERTGNGWLPWSVCKNGKVDCKS